MRRLLTFVLDVALVGLATLLSVLLRDDLAPTMQHITGIGVYLTVGLVMATLVMPSLGVSRSIWRFTGLDDAARIGASAALIVAASVGVGFVVDRLEHVPRSLPVIQFLLIVALQISVRVFARVMYTRRARRKVAKMSAAAAAPSVVSAAAPKSVLVVGVGDLADLYLRSVAAYASDRVRVEGVLGRQERHVGRVISGVPVLGTPEQLPLVIAELELRGVNIEKVVVAESFRSLSDEAKQEILKTDRQFEVEVELLSESLGLGRSNREIELAREALSAQETASPDKGQQRVMHVLSDEQMKSIARRPYWVVKRVIDFAVALLLILVLAPVMMIVAATVALELGAPVVFWQKRPARGGVPIRVYKFRTMRGLHNREGHRLSDLERAAPVATWLRLHRLDELPQLVNILVGQMSFIGPRPLLPIDQPAAGHPRLLVRPGLTGWAQVNGGRDLSIEDKSALDLWYVQNASFHVDFAIVLRTVRVLLRGEKRDEKAIREARTLAVPSVA